ncbi:phenazine biosynthesis protein [Nocardiopsis algeriensis]|uniref:phenazine biosynthesis protein n=1 Tax=Nocardiopsis algeriensis TaxID=1478215 RepID=UPI003B437775
MDTTLLNGTTAAEAAKDPDAYVRHVLRWHFSPATGSRFWRERRALLDFDPLRDVGGLADLALFPDFSEDLRTVPVEHLIPAGSTRARFEVFESGGTTGAPKRVVDAVSRGRNVAWVSSVLREHGFPDRGHWLHVGPGGPHVVGRTVRHLAAERDALCFTLDLDPRWVKRLLAEGRTELAAEYREYLLDQIELIVQSQDIRAMFITPPVLEALCARDRLYETVAAKVKGLLWAGTSISPESLSQIENTFFPDAAVAAIYGNTLMGIAPQRPKAEGGPFPCVFEPYFPQSAVRVVDPGTREAVGYGERGQVLIHLLSEDMFLPNVLERDTALRVPPAPGSDVDGLADIQPLRTPGAGRIIEGVY